MTECQQQRNTAHPFEKKSLHICLAFAVSIGLEKIQVASKGKYSYIEIFKFLKQEEIIELHYHPFVNPNKTWKQEVIITDS